ncbi:hypothetical protein J6590_045647 [Homalodisca vitripennis]|nr:hypothetical protein J6590_045647 [Homalodisca vitripennis]
MLLLIGHVFVLCILVVSDADDIYGDVDDTDVMDPLVCNQVSYDVVYNIDEMAQNNRPIQMEYRSTRENSIDRSDLARIAALYNPRQLNIHDKKRRHVCGNLLHIHLPLSAESLGCDAVTDLTPGIWSHVHLKRSKKVCDE